MKSFAIEPDAIHEFGSKNTTIRLGNTIQKSIYFTVRYHEYNNTWEILAVTKALHDELLPLEEKRHAPTDTI